MNEDWILVERRGVAGVITVNRPDVHDAWGREQLLVVERALDDFAADPDVHAVILTGAGSKAFIAGGDIADLDTRRGIEHYADMGEIIHRVFRRFETFDKLTIAAVNGLALGTTGTCPSFSTRSTKLEVTPWASDTRRRR